MIVGAGPAGAALAYLLARRGIGVTLIERHSTFERTFRGDGLQPSGLDAFDQMGLGDDLRRLPKALVRTIEIHQRGRRRARIDVQSLGFIPCFVPQPAVLAMLTEQASRYPPFRLHMGTSVRELVRDGDRVVGVRTDGVDGPRELAADLVVGADGRYSTVRALGGFDEPRSPQHFDVLNFVVPFPDFWPDHTTVRLELGPGCLTGGIPTADGRLWVGMTIQKGAYKTLRDGADGLTGELLRRTSPDLAAHLRAHPDALARPVLLDVKVGCLPVWTAPGLLLLGDAAHPMAPNGGQGINVALRDALVAANHLGPALAKGAAGDALDAAAARVTAERLPEIAAIQEHQRQQTRTFLGSDRLSARLAMRLLPFLARSGLARVLVGKRLHELQHGTVHVRLTA